MAEIERPVIGADEVLVQVHAAGLDRGTWHLMAGMPYAARLAVGLRAPKNPVPGLDVAGVVVAVGSEVTRFQPGDEVFGVSKGSFAEFAAAREDKLARKPSNLTFEQAAAVPVSGMTALRGLVRRRPPRRQGQKVLIVGASGGVGSYAVQIAKALGAEVTGVCSTSKLDLVRSIGADHVIDYSQDDFADGETAVRLDPRHRRQLIALTAPASAHCPTARSSSSAAKAEAAGSAWTANCERSPCHRSSASD